MIDRRRDLRPVERMAIGEHEHADAELYFFRAAGEKGEAGERLEERPVRRHDEAAAFGVRVRRLDLPWNHDAVGAPDRIVAESFRLPRGLRQRLGTGGAAGD